MSTNSPQENTMNYRPTWEVPNDYITYYDAAVNNLIEEEVTVCQFTESPGAEEEEDEFYYFVVCTFCNNIIVGGDVGYSTFVLDPQNLTGRNPNNEKWMALYFYFCAGCAEKIDIYPSTSMGDKKTTRIHELSVYKPCSNLQG